MRRALLLLALVLVTPAFAYGDPHADDPVDSIWHAVRWHDAKAVAAMLQADPALAKRADVDGRTPLHFARIPEIVKLLVAAGADVNAQTSFAEFTPLREAASRGDKAVVQALLAAGAKVDLGHPATLPLQTAAYNGQKEIAGILIAHGASVNATRSTEAPPLDTAAARGYTDIVQLLLDHKADINATFMTDNAVTRHEVTTLDDLLERKTPNMAMVEYLRAHGAKRFAELQEPGARAASKAEQEAAVRASVRAHMGDEAYEAADKAAAKAKELMGVARNAALGLHYHVTSEGPQFGKFKSGGVTLETEVFVLGSGRLRFTGIVASKDGDERALEARKFRAVFFKLLGIERAEQAPFDMDGNFVEY